MLKAHPYHPELSALTGEAVIQGVRDAGAPEGTFAVVTGREAGVAALTDERIAAGAFTGSADGGRVLFEIASLRRRPIPFYGELSSVNPVFVTSQASAQRGLQIADQLVRSFTLGAGNFAPNQGSCLCRAGVRSRRKQRALLRKDRPRRCSTRESRPPSNSPSTV